MQTSTLLQMLMTRQMAAGNPAVADLLARMNSTGGGTPNVQELLAQLAQRNPTLAALTQQMSGAANTSAAPPAAIEGEVVEVPEDSPMTMDQHEIEELRAHSQRQDGEIAALRDRVDRCAAALGACGACWGTDPACRACRGHGRPGFAKPDETLFEEMILPAVRTLRSLRGGAAPQGRPHAVRQATAIHEANTARAIDHHST
jgi:hypothetical protein